MVKKKREIIKPEPKKVREDIMESVLKRVNAIEGLLILKTEEVDKLAIENEKVAGENKALSSKLNAKAKEIKEREEKVKPIEDVSDFMNKATEVLKDANKKMKEALKEQDLADKKNLENKQAVERQNVKIAKEKAEILDEKAGLKKGYEQLAKAEDNSEKKIVTAIVGKIKKG